eukprot:UN12436
MGSIPDWKPVSYNSSELVLPFWIPDNPQARGDYAAYLTSFSRIDQGVGLFIDVLQERDLLKDTLIIFSSDNGMPFTSAKTNLYEQGQIEPFMISLPQMWENGFNGPVFTDYIAGNTDIFPTILDWLNLTYPSYVLNGANVVLTGESLLEVVQNNITTNERKSNVYGSHMFHEVTMYYPMRVATNGEYRLIYNMAYQNPYHVAEDIYGSASWQQIVKDSDNGNPTGWYKEFN